MKLENLLNIKDYKEGLDALYKEYDLKLGEEDDSELYTKYPEDLEDSTTTEEQRREYIQDHLAFREANIHIKTNYGWDMTQLWNLDETLFQFLLPRLYIFYKTDLSLEQDYGEDGTFKDILEAILDALLNVLYTTTNEGFEEAEHSEEKINKGMLLLGKYIRRLWN